MKKLFVFAMVATALTIFNGCQKEEPVLIDEQQQEALNPDVYADGDCLAFKNFEVYDSVASLLNSSSLEFIKDFENDYNFKSAFTYRQECVERLENLSKTEASSFLNKLSVEGYFDLNEKEFKYPFYNETKAVVFNPKGKVKIGKTYYTFEGYDQIMTPDLSNLGIKGDVNNFKKTINHKELSGSMLKSATILFDNTTAGGQQRLTMRVLREGMYAYDWIPYQGEIVWGVVGFHWEVSLRFHSWRQRALSKSDENTYFHWIANQFTVGGNNNFWPYNYSNPNYVGTSPWKAIYYLEIYDSGLIEEPIIPPYTHVDAECWSDRLTSPRNYVYYTD